MKTKARSGFLAGFLSLVLMFLLCFGLEGRAAEAQNLDVPTLPPPTDVSSNSGERLSDDDGDGILFYSFRYKGSAVYALIVLDPSRIFVGTAVPEPDGHGNGLTLDELAEQYGAVAGINAGGFLDEAGAGNGWPPRGITISRGMTFSTVGLSPIAGFNGEDRLWSGWYSYDDCLLMGIRDAVCFGPTLVSEGVPTSPEKLESGIGARTLIGQRADGAVVLVVIDGRQGYSIGVTMADCALLMAEKFGCVEASNMDGGSSTSMIFRGEAINRSSNQASGTRYLPDAWLVKPLPADYVKPDGVPTSIVLPGNALGEAPEYLSACDPDTSERLYAFACEFAETFYGYFGTTNGGQYHSALLRYLVEGSDLRARVDQALLDRHWVNTWRTDAADLELVGAWLNQDGSYDVLIRSNIREYASYWTYDAPGTELRITVVEAPETRWGYLVSAVY